MTHQSQQWIDVGPTSSCPPGKVIEAVVAGEIVAIANVDGQFYALDGICAHQGGPLGRGKLDGCRLTCPWHGWQYDVPTGQQMTAASIRQRTYRARAVGDTIQVHVADGSSAGPT